jgi:hypothetical protein
MTCSLFARGGREAVGTGADQQVCVGRVETTRSDVIRTVTDFDELPRVYVHGPNFECGY